MNQPRRRTLSLEEYAEGVRAGNRTILARAMTLLESNLPAHRAQAQQLLQLLLPYTENSHRIGITGVPGVGKSSFIERLGMDLLDQGHHVAVLAIDPTSAIRGGSILGDKTRMVRLAADPRAFIRPSPSQGHLGGVHRKTREAMLVCEAAGFDVILVETVGVGQSEIAVANMVDTSLILMLAGAGDELQGIKKGILEIADLIAINKADGDNALAAKRARIEYQRALQLVHSPHADPNAPPTWTPQLLTCSALEGTGIQDVWQALQAHRQFLESTGQLQTKRQRQRLQWLWATLEQELLFRFRHAPHIAPQLPEIEKAVLQGTLPPTLAAEQLLSSFFSTTPLQ